MIDDDVGYKKPPKGTRFKPGQSGNPKGRPRGTRNFRTDVKSTLQSTIQVTKDGKPKRVSTQEAALMRLREKALKGDARALERLLLLAQNFNGDDEVQLLEDELDPEDEDILKAFMSRRYGIPEG